MNLLKTYLHYIEKICSAANGPTVMLVDSISVAWEIFLVDLIENSEFRSELRCLHCIVFVRPNTSTISILATELATPKYASYSLYFTNSLKPSQIEFLAKEDIHEKVVDLNEVFLDLYLSSEYCFYVGIESCYPVRLINHWDRDGLKRCTDSIVALSLSLQKKLLIRYMSSSPMTYQLARSDAFKEDSQLFSFPKVCDTSTILLILDRSIDPITPLLIPWTYQSMLHEFFTLHDDRISVQSGTNTDSIALSFQASQDAFFADNRCKYYGDVGLALKGYIQDFFDMRGRHLKIDSLSEMKKFTDQHGQFSEREANVQKHVKLLEMLHSVVDSQSLYEVSEFEQSLVSMSFGKKSAYFPSTPLTSSLSTATPSTSIDPEAERVLSQLKTLLSTGKLATNEIKFKIAILVMLKIGLNSSRIYAEIKTIFSNFLETPEMELLELIRKQYSSLDFKIEGEHSTGTTPSLNIFKDSIFRAKQAFTSTGGKDDVELVYTQHKPTLHQVIELLVKGRLSERQFPFFDTQTKEKFGTILIYRPKEAILFFVNGVTFEEMRLVTLYNSQELGSSLLIGGTSIVNSSIFINDLKRAHVNKP